MRAFVVVPVFDNAPTIREVVRGALGRGLPVVVVDDGSTDGSGTAVADLPVERLTHPRNLGKGAAILAGARRAEEMGASHVVVLDADGQLDPTDLLPMLDAAREHPLAIVCGVRRFREGDVPFASRFGRGFSNFWTRACSGAKVADSQCGFRVYPVKTLLGLPVRGKRFDFEVEALVRAAWAGVEIVGVPVAVTYAPPGGRMSAFRPIVDNLRISRAYTRLFFRAMVLPGGPGGSLDPNDLSAARPSMRHPIRLLRSLLGERSSPAELGAAAALGLFVATLPLVGFHTFAVVATASFFGLNRLMAFSASHLCMPPFVPACCLFVGYFVRHGRWLDTFDADLLFRQIHERLIDYLTGTVVVAPVLAAAGGFVTFCIAAALRHQNGGGAASAGPADGRAAVYGTRPGIEFFEVVLKRAGLAPAYVCLGFVVTYYILFRPGVRRSMAPYLRRRFPGRGPLRRLVLSFRLLMEFSRGMVDQGAVQIRGKDYFHATIDDEEGFHDVLARGRGTVLLLAHVGGWRIAMHYLGCARKPVHMMLHQQFEGPAQLAFDAPAAAAAFRIIDTGPALGGVLEATAALLRHEVVGIMGDRSWGGRTVSGTFLGDPVAVLRMPYKLAFSTGSQLLMLFAVRTGYRKLRIFHREIGGDADLAAVGEDEAARMQAAAFLAAIEAFLAEYPYHWFNFFDFWKTGLAPQETLRRAPSSATRPDANGRAARKETT